MSASAAPVDEPQPCRAKRVLIFATSFAPAIKAGGPARSITNLARLAALSASVDVVAPDRDLGDASPFPGVSGQNIELDGARVNYLDTRSVHQWSDLLRRLRTSDYDLVLLNSVWNVPLSITPAALIALRLIHTRATVLMPRGELEPGALLFGSRKKRIAAPLVRQLYGRVVTAFVATSATEKRNIERYFRQSRVLVTGNNTPDILPFRCSGEQQGQLRIGFASRIHAKKGLLEALTGLTRVSCPVELQIAGTIEDPEYWSACQSAIRRLPDNVRAKYVGVLARDQVSDFFGGLDYTILLTAGENYGHVIAESLQSGCPVIITPTTPWTDAVRQGGGALVDDPNDAEAVAEVVESCWEVSKMQGKEARRQARAVYEHFAATAGPNAIDLAISALLSCDYTRCGPFGESSPRTVRGF